MTLPAIRIESLGKQYQLGLAKRRGYRTFREAIVEAALAPWRRFRHFSGRGSESSRFWALRDVSFEVQAGAVVGIIGRNGAGKSTLLKILSQITEPTTGRVEMRGRVGSLLEVGTGFHPELTGRENIFLNGAILGMSRSEVRRKFDDIVGFAGVDGFLDTPVKRYSSGMHVRLAFAVAAHLEPEILVVDEVLAVGDAEFQKKCLGKMGEVASGGRTILFVSHNMAAIESLCSSAILLESGRVVASGSVEGVISRYLAAGCETCCDVDLRSHGGRVPGAAAVLQRLRITDLQGIPLPAIPLGEDAVFEIELHSATPMPVAHLAIGVVNSRGQRIMTCQTKRQHSGHINVQGRTVVSCTIRNWRLLPGVYALHLQVLSQGRVVDRIDSGLSFEVAPKDVYGTGKLPRPNTGIFAPEVSWHVVTREV